MPPSTSVVSSSEPSADPVKVILRYAGKTYDEFYLAEVGNFGPNMKLKDSTSELIFTQQGGQTIYFFPELAPFGASATATVEQLEPMSS